jgi:hypothetical protein
MSRVMKATSAERFTRSHGPENVLLGFRKISSWKCRAPNETIAAPRNRSTSVESKES